MSPALYLIDINKSCILAYQLYLHDGGCGKLQFKSLEFVQKTYRIDYSLNLTIIILMSGWVSEMMLLSLILSISYFFRLFCWIFPFPFRFFLSQLFLETNIWLSTLTKKFVKEIVKNFFPIELANCCGVDGLERTIFRAAFYVTF